MTLNTKIDTNKQLIINILCFFFYAFSFSTKNVRFNFLFFISLRVCEVNRNESGWQVAVVIDDY